MIKTRSNVWGHQDETARREWVYKLLAVHGLIDAINRLKESNWKITGKVDAEIHQSQWVVGCPVPGCRSSELGDPDWPVFVCSGGCGAGPIQVTFPSSREEIERLLLERPVPATRGWLKGETVARLKKENADMAEQIAKAKKLLGVK